MTLINTLYYEWADKSSDAEDTEIAENELIDYINTNMSRKQVMSFEPIYISYAELNQKQGFIAGFAVAMNLIADVIRNGI